MVWNDPEQLGFCREDDGLFTKDIKPLLGTEDGRAGEKGSSELLTVVSMQVRALAPATEMIATIRAAYPSSEMHLQLRC